MRLPALLLTIALVGFAARPAHAQTCTTEWVSPTDGDWSDGTNWTAGVPDSSDVACITLPGDYTVTAFFSFIRVRIAGLVVGGASGTQTLLAEADIGVFGDAFVRPNGRVETIDAPGPSGSRFDVDGTLLVEGTLVHRAGGTALMQGTAGTLDVAPGGQLLLAEAGAIVGNAGSLLRIRGLFEGSCGGGAACVIDSPLEVEGATIRMLSGTAQFRAGGTIDGVDLDVPAGAGVLFTGGGTRRFVLEGTVAGDPEGFVSWFSVEVAAGPDDATLALGGTGFLMTNQSGVGTILTSAGGAFLNTGLVVVPNTFSGLSGSVLTNEGVMRIADAGFFEVFNGALLRNAPGGLLELTDNVTIRGNGRIENAGLIVRSGGGLVNFPQSMLRSRPGSEIRLVGGGIGLPEPAALTLPAGAALTGSGTLGISRDYRIEGTLSPGTDAEPFGTLALAHRYYPSRTAGTPRLVIDVGADGQSDRLDIVNESGPLERGRLAGALIVRVAPGYTPAVGDAFTIVSGPLPESVTGQFDVIASESAPEGLAFVTEVVGADVLLRVVEAAPDGPITVSTTAPVGGAVRSVFLTGPGAVGVSAARLECTECLDPDAWGSIPAEVVGEGTLKEARFDLTNPRAFGFYDLVLQRPGKADTTVATTVRPYLSYVLTEGGSNTGIRVRPPGMGYNWSAVLLGTETNADEPSFLLPRVRRADSTLVSLLLATANPFSGGTVFFESDAAEDPTDAPLAFGRVPADGAVTLTLGLRISPEDVLFPEQTPDGPDDPRLPFGEVRPIVVLSAQHLSRDRTARLVETALRGTSNAALDAYLADVDADDAGAVERAVRDALDRRERYVGSPPALLGGILGETDGGVPVPGGLAEAAAPAFAEAVGAERDAFIARIEAAHGTATTTAPAAVRDLFAAEVAALFPEGLPGSDDPLAAGAPRRGGDTPIEGLLRCFGFGPSIDGIQSIGDGSAAAGGGGGGGGTVCSPLAGAVDPNDKLAEANLACELGTVVVDGEDVTRCVRHFVPLALAEEPLLYTVTFENLPEATADAEFVTITDEIDENLNLASLEVLATSSDSTFSYSVAGRTVTFRFVGIDLPPNGTPPEGEGFVKFSLRPVAGLETGAEIRNDASIVFDFNPPIETPEVVHELRPTTDLAALVLGPDEAGIGEPLAFRVSASNLQGDPADDATLTISWPDAPLVSVSTAEGECTSTAPVVCAFGTLDGGATATVEVVVQPEAGGAFTLSAVAATSAFDVFAPNDADAATVTLVTVGNEDESAFPREVTLAPPYPNPSRGAATLRWGLPEAGRVDVRVYDLLGREVARLAEGQATEAGWHETRWQAAVASGVYIVRLQAESGRRTVSKTRRLVVVR
jgi:hypothetical protein